MANFGGGLLSDIFSKKHSKSLKLTLENGQKSGFYKIKFPKLQREDNIVTCTKLLLGLCLGVQG